MSSRIHIKTYVVHNALWILCPEPKIGEKKKETNIINGIILHNMTNLLAIMKY